jgi:hypothetical protein
VLSKAELSERLIKFYRARGYVRVKNAPREQLVAFRFTLPDGRYLTVYGNNRMRIIDPAVKPSTRKRRGSAR